MIANTSIIKIDFVIIKPEIWNISVGILGTINRRVKKTVITAGSPNKKAVLKSIKSCLYFGIVPMRLLIPTMNREDAVAIVVSILNK